LQPFDFPDLNFLAKWQVDLNLRRAGNMGSSSLIPVDLSKVENTSKEHYAYKNQTDICNHSTRGAAAPLNDWLLCSTKWLNDYDLHQSGSSHSLITGMKRDNSLTNYHLVNALEMLDEYITPSTIVTHLEISILFPLLLRESAASVHHVFTSPSFTKACEYILELKVSAIEYIFMC
jgi:hypothetical protein